MYPFYKILSDKRYRLLSECARMTSIKNNLKMCIPSGTTTQWTEHRFNSAQRLCTGRAGLRWGPPHHLATRQTAVGTA